MGIFSFFKRKNTQAGSPTSPGTARRQRAENDAHRSESTQARLREIARATAMKIDAIESAMTFDLFNPPRPAHSPDPTPPPLAPPASEDDVDTDGAGAIADAQERVIDRGLTRLPPG